MSEVLDDIKKIESLLAENTEDAMREAEEYLESYPIVHEEFEEGGRWSNYSMKVYRLESERETRYFMVDKEVPATEIQEGGDFEISVYEVHPIEKTVIVYE